VTDFHHHYFVLYVYIIMKDGRTHRKERMTLSIFQIECLHFPYVDRDSVLFVVVILVPLFRATLCTTFVLEPLPNTTESLLWPLFIYPSPN